MWYNFCINTLVGGGFLAGKEQKRLTLRFDKKDAERLEYWAGENQLSLSAFIVLMLDTWVDIKNGNYELPTLEIQRLNQLIEQITVLSKNVSSLESVTISGFDSLLRLTRGDNYLLEDEDGEIGV